MPPCARTTIAGRRRSRWPGGVAEDYPGHRGVAVEGVLAAVALTDKGCMKIENYTKSLR